MASNLPKPNTVIKLRAADVWGETADLRLRVHEIGYGEPVHRNAEWVTVEGMALNDDDTVRGERSALVRVEALKKQSESDDADASD